MIAFELVQTNVRDTIAAGAYFAAESVVLDEGIGESERELALKTRGFCVTVAPVLSANLVNQSGSTAIVDATVGVLVEINPKTNPAGANKDIYEAVRAVIEVLFAPVPTHPSDNYQLAANAVEFSDFDPGLLGYIVTFNKRCVI